MCILLSGSLASVHILIYLCAYYSFKFACFQYFIYFRLYNGKVRSLFIKQGEYVTGRVLIVLNKLIKYIKFALSQESLYLLHPRYSYYSYFLYFYFCPYLDPTKLRPRCPVIIILLYILFYHCSY